MRIRPCARPATLRGASDEFQQERALTPVVKDWLICSLDIDDTALRELGWSCVKFVTGIVTWIPCPAGH